MQGFGDYLSILLYSEVVATSFSENLAVSTERSVQRGMALSSGRWRIGRNVVYLGDALLRLRW